MDYWRPIQAVSPWGVKPIPASFPFPIFQSTLLRLEVPPAVEEDSHRCSMEEFICEMQGAKKGE